MAINIDEIRNSAFYKNATPDVKQRIESNYENENISTTDRLVGTAKNLAEDVSNITKDPNRPDADINPTVTTQNIKPGAATQGGLVNGNSWEDIVRSGFFQSADDDTRDKIKSNFESQGGITPGALATTANTLLTGAGAIAHEGVRGVALGTSYLLQMAKETDHYLGDEGSMLDNALQSSQDYLTGSVNKIDEMYNQNVGQLAKGSEATRVAEKYAPAIELGAETLITGGANLGVRAAMSAGTHYYNEPEEERSLGRSALMGSIDYAVGKFIPGSKMAQSAERTISEVASPYVNKVLTTGLGKAAGVAVAAGEGSAIGGATGYGSTVTDSLLKGESLEEANKKGVESAKEGATMGAVLGGGFHAITPATNIKVDDAVKAKVKSTVDDINNSKTATDRDTHFEQAKDYTAATAADNLTKHGFEPVNQSARAGEEAAKVMGVSKSNADKDAVDIDSIKSNLATTKDNLRNTHQEAMHENNKLFDEVKAPVENEAITPQSKQVDSLRNDAIKTINALHKSYASAKKTYNETVSRDLAVQAHDKLEALHKVAPEEAQHLADNITSPVTGKKGGVDFVGDAHQVIQQRKILDATESAVNSGKKSLSSIIKSTTSHGVQHYVANHLFGFEGNIALAIGNKAIGHGVEQLKARARSKQSSRIQENVSKAQPTSTVEAPIKSTGAYTTSEGRAQARTQRTVKTGVEAAKSQFADHPDIASKINESNFRDLSSFKEERAAKVATDKATARQAERETAAKATAADNKKAITDFQRVNPHLNELFPEASRNLASSGKEPTSANFEKEVNALAEGKKPLTSGEKKRFAKAGSKEEYLEDVRKNKLIPDEVKEEQKSLIKLYHQGLEPGKSLGVKAQQNLHRSLADVESNFFTKHGATNESTQAKARGEDLAQRVQTRADITLRHEQSNNLEDHIKSTLKDKGLSERKTKKFIREKQKELASKGIMSPSEFNHHLDSITHEASNLSSPTTPSSKPKPPKQDGDTGAKDSGLSETQIKGIRDKYTHELTDSLGSKDFDKRLDELEAFREDHDLADTRTDAMFDHYVDTLTKVHELKQQGITDPKALISQEMVKRFTHQGVTLGKNFRDSLGIDKDSILPEKQRKQLEEDIRSGVQAKRDRFAQRARGTTGAKLTRIQGAKPSKKGK